MNSREFLENHLNSYSSKEIKAINHDFDIIKALTFNEAVPHSIPEQPVYLATAGAPGTSKSTTLESYLKQNQLTHYVHVDPDQMTLKNMVFTYRQSLTNYELAKAPSLKAALTAAYQKWREASNYISLKLLQLAFGEADQVNPYSIAHGVTSTNDQLESFYQRIKAKNYRIALLVCHSSAETQLKAINRREKEQAFIQTVAEDIVSKTQAFLKKFDLYFRYADDIHFYWNDELLPGKLPTACATWHRENDKVVVHQSKEWQQFCDQYVADIKKLNERPCDVMQKIVLNTAFHRASLFKTQFTSVETSTPSPPFVSSLSP